MPCPKGGNCYRKGVPREPAHHVCSCLWCCSEAAPVHVPFSAVFIPDLVLGCGGGQAVVRIWLGLRAEALWLQESRWLCFLRGPELRPWQTSSRTCLPQIRLQVVVWSGWSQSVCPFGLGSSATCRSLCPDWCASQHACTPCEWSLGFSSPVCPSRFPSMHGLPTVALCPYGPPLPYRSPPGAPVLC